MQYWQVDDGQVRFSELLERCLTEGPQMVIQRGAEAAVLVPADEWRRLHACANPSMKELLMSDKARAEIAVGARGQARSSKPNAFR